MTDKQAKDMSAATDQGRFDEGYTNKWYFYEATFEVTNTDVYKRQLLDYALCVFYGWK